MAEHNCLKAILWPDTFFDTFYFIVGFLGQEKPIDIGCLVYEQPNNLGPAFDSTKQR